MRYHFSLVPPQGSIYFRLEQVRSAPSPSALSLLVSHLRPGNTLSRLRALPLSALSFGLLFALPAARAGYDATLAFAHIGVPSEWWREAFAVVGAVTVGGTAWARMSMVRNPTLRTGVAPVPPQPPMGAAATSR
jgi:hypothetical protein